jgi:hypothetical protein
VGAQTCAVVLVDLLENGAAGLPALASQARHVVEEVELRGEFVVCGRLRLFEEMLDQLVFEHLRGWAERCPSGRL